MTTIDPFNSVPGTVDSDTAISALHDLLSMFHGEAMAGGSGISSGIGDMSSQEGMKTDVSQTTTVPAATSTTSGDHASPVPAGTAISQPFGVSNGHERSHPGIDFAVPLDTQLLAAASGRVTVASGGQGGYGNLLEITTPDGFAIRYGHLHSMSVKVGDEVHAGQIVGTSGGEAGGAGSGNSTGPHLHFEVDVNGTPVDPTPFLAGGYQVIGGPASGSSTTTTIKSTPDPKAIGAVALQNTMNAMTGDPLQELAQPSSASSTQTTPGQAQAGTGSGADDDPGAIDTFLTAVRAHESGGGVWGNADYHVRNNSGKSNAAGAYQFIGTTWKGMGGSTESAADAPPAEQDAIARKMATQLFNEFHSWRLVAVAWYGGPGVAEQAARGQNPGSPDGQPPYLEYGDWIQHQMALHGKAA